MRTVNVGVDALPDTLFVIDKERHTYLGLSRDESYWHVIAPSQVDATDPETGQVVRPAGELGCSCRGGTFHGHCYWLTAALRLEAEQALPRWMRRRVAPETELETAARRG